ESGRHGTLSWRGSSPRGARPKRDAAGLLLLCAACENGAGAEDALALDEEIGIGGGEPAAALLDVDMRFDPGPQLGAAGEGGAEGGGEKGRRRVLAIGEAVAEGDIRERHEKPAMHEAACVHVLFENAERDDEALAVAAEIERAGRVEEWAGAKEGCEAGG